MDVLKELRKRLSRSAVDISPETLSVYSYDASKSEAKPSAVVYATIAEDVVSTVNFARQYNLPLAVRGAGSGLSGGAVPLNNGILLSLERMNQILHIDPDNGLCVAEPGVVNADLQSRLLKYGLFFPCDPGSAAFATLGGNAAENACGMRGRYYGSCLSHVKGLEYVNSEGRIVSTGCLNNNRNLILQRLLLGSEGTLGIITKLALSLVKVPPGFSTALLYFNDENRAFALVQALLGRGLVPYALEYADSGTFPLIVPRDSPLFRDGVRALVLLETPPGDRAFEKQAAGCGAFDVVPARNAAERARFWEIRNSISPALYNAGRSKLNEDVGVPVNALPALGAFLQSLSESARDVKIFTFGHLCAGCFHVNFMFDERAGNQKEEAERLLERLFRKVVELSGTLSCEHGIGLTKKRFLPLEFAPDTLAFHHDLKRAFDPDGLFNPGKIFEEEAHD